MSEPSAVDASDQHRFVDVMLESAGISLTAEDREGLLAMYAVCRPGIQAMYALPEARYESPALVFQAQPKLANWRNS